MENLNLKLRGLSKENYIKTLKEVAEVSSKIRINMLKDILRLPLVPFIDIIFEWINQYDYKLMEIYVNLEDESLANLIDILDKKFEEWLKTEQNPKRYDKLNKIESRISLNKETPPSNENVNEELKYKLLQMLAELGDRDSTNVLNSFEKVVNNHDTKEKFINLVNVSNLDKNTTSEELLNFISNSISLKIFIGILDSAILSTHPNEPRDLKNILASKIIINDNDWNDSLKQRFYIYTRILPDKIISNLGNHFYVFVKKKDFEKAKRIKKEILTHLPSGRMIIIETPTNLMELIINIFLNVFNIYIHDIKVNWDNQTGEREVNVAILKSREDIKIDEVLCEDIEFIFKHSFILEEFTAPINIKTHVISL